MKKIKFFIEYAFVLGLDLFFQLWPRSWAIRMGEWLGLFASRLLRSRHRLILTNLSRAFPDYSQQQINSIARKFWLNLGRMAAEFIRMSDITSDNYKDYFDVEGLDLYQKAKQEGKGVIFVGFHFTNWEYTAVAIKRFLGDVVAIARPMKNPWVQAWVLKKRSMGETDIILHREAVKGCLRALKAQRNVGILVDQNLYTGGVFVDFFNRPAATTPLPALLESRRQMPILVAYLRRTNNKFVLIFEAVAPQPSLWSEDDALRKRTQVISQMLEQIIRKSPESWFWIHNRWKRQPLHS